MWLVIFSTEFTGVVLTGLLLRYTVFYLLRFLFLFLLVIGSVFDTSDVER